MGDGLKLQLNKYYPPDPSLIGDALPAGESYVLPGQAQPDPSLMPASAVPAAPQAASGMITMPQPQAAAPADPAAQRSAAIAGALEHFYQPTVPDPADARILSTIPYQDPIRSQRLDQAYGVGGITNQQSSSSTRMDPAAMKAAESAGRHSAAQGKAMIDAGRLAASNADQLANEQAVQAQKLEAQARADFDAIQSRQAKVDEAINAQQKDVDTFLKSQKEVDPSRLMRGGRGIMAAIAAGIGGFGAGLTHTDNSAMQIINHAIDRDWQAQKDVVNANREKIEQSGKLVQQLRQSLGDDQSVKLAHGAAMRQAFADRMQGMALRFKGTEAEANSLGLAEQLQVDADRFRAELAARQTVTVGNSTSTNVVPMAKTNPNMDALTAFEAQTEKEHNIAKNRFQAPTEADNSQKVKALETATQAASILRPLQDLRTSLKNATLPGLDVGLGKQAELRNQAFNIAQEAFGRLQSGGAITSDEDKRFAKMFAGGPTAITSDMMDMLVRKYQTWMATKVRTELNTVHPAYKDQAWQQVKSGVGDDRLFNQLYTGKFEDAGDELKSLGATPRTK